jgi:hypothetical protein
MLFITGNEEESKKECFRMFPNLSLININITETDLVLRDLDTEFMIKLPEYTC